MNTIELKRTDCIYESGFPANIDWDLDVIVQIMTGQQGVILYSCKHRGVQARCFLPLELNDKYTSGISIF